MKRIIAALCIMLMGSAVHAQLAEKELEVRELSRQCIYGDCVNGYGTLEIKTTLGTNTYRGNFKDGLYHGNGKLTELISVTERAYYDGNWVAGIKNGRGTFFNGKSELYIGEWKDNVRHGKGSYFFGLNDWTENKYTEHWLAENVENYTGDFRDDYFSGQGTYRWPDGQKYVGGFFANEKHGPGTFHYPRGTIRQQMWEYGEFLH